MKARAVAIKHLLAKYSFLCFLLSASRNIFIQMSFTKLAVELRIIIWTDFHDLTPPSTWNPIVTHVPKSHPASLLGDDEFLPTTEHPQLFLNGARAIPAVLHVCHESRELGLKWYTLGFRFDKQVIMRNPHAPRPFHCSNTSDPRPVKVADIKVGVYYNASKDVFYFSHMKPLGWTHADMDSF